jgi:pimeloyl-ACP methyl ester carboxylesterase
MRCEVNGIGLEVQDEGSGPPVLLLHGWPDSHRLWRHQVSALTAAGYRCIAPDLRGFGESDRPTEVEAYALPLLAADVLGVLDQLGVDRAHVVGHDWGAALAWALAALAPDRVDHLVAMSVGHLTSFREAGWAQREKSWYMLLFQFEGIAEQWLSNDGFTNFRSWSGHPDADAVTADLSRPGAITASLNWYRANIPPSSLLEAGIELPPIAAPTMGIWSSGDIALLETQMTGSAAHVKGPWRYERIDGAGHWMQLEQPDTVNALLLDFLPKP